MNHPAVILLEDAKQSLFAQLNHRDGLACSDEAMLIWLLGPDVTGKQFTQLLQVADQDSSLEQYQSVASAGFAAASGALPSNVETLLPSALVYQSGRKPFSGRTPMRFCSDGVALLGIVLACRFVNDSATTTRVNEWLKDFLPTVLRSGSHSRWELEILNSVFAVAGGEVDTSFISPHVRLALQHQGVLPLGDDDQQSELCASVLHSAKSGSFHGRAVVENALALAALNVASTCSFLHLKRPSVEDLVLLLNRVPSSLKRWAWESKPLTQKSVARKWYIDHEYHVQGLLYAILAPLFADIREEENFPSVGQKKPRADLFIPSLRVIIEVKYARESVKLQDTIGEISEDCGLYLAHRGELTIVPFIWDAARRTDQHSVLRRGLMELPGVFDAVIISAPGWLN